MAWIVPGTLQGFSWTKQCWRNPHFCDIPDFKAVGLLPSCAHAISGNSYSCENRVWNNWGRSCSPFAHSWEFNCNTDHCGQRLLSKEVVAGYSDQINSNACWGNVSFQDTALDVFNCLFFIKGSCKYQMERKMQIQRTTGISPQFHPKFKSTENSCVREKPVPVLHRLLCLAYYWVNLCESRDVGSCSVAPAQGSSSALGRSCSLPHPGSFHSSHNEIFFSLAPALI